MSSGARRAVAVGLAMLAVHDPAASQGAGSSVRGVILEHETGAPLAGAVISLTPEAEGAPSPGSLISGGDGAFRFGDVPPGTYALTVERIGLRTYRHSLVVAPDADLRMVVELSPSPVELEAVVVVVDRSPMMAGFEARRRRARGTFITRDSIEAANPVFVTDLLRVVPGVTYVRRRSGNLLGNLEIRMRGGCRPTVWVNGTRAIDQSAADIGIDALLSPYEVEAVEVYRGAAEVPVQFGPEPCGAVVLWTRQRPAQTMAGSTWKKAAMATGIVVMILLMRS